MLVVAAFCSSPRGAGDPPGEISVWPQSQTISYGDGCCAAVAMRIQVYVAPVFEPCLAECLPMPLQEHPRGAALRCGVGVKPLGVELTSRYFWLKVRNLPKAP